MNSWMTLQYIHTTPPYNPMEEPTWCRRLFVDPLHAPCGTKPSLMTPQVPDLPVRRRLSVWKGLTQPPGCNVSNHCHSQALCYFQVLGLLTGSNTSLRGHGRHGLNLSPCSKGIQTWERHFLSSSRSSSSKPWENEISAAAFPGDLHCTNPCSFTDSPLNACEAKIKKRVYLQSSSLLPPSP